MADSIVPDPVRAPSEVAAVAKRRRFSAKYKRRILRESAACTARGELGALLRREGLYSSHLTKWRQLEEQGALAGLAPKKRGPAAKPVDARDRQLAEAEKALRKMTRRAERAEALVEVQKKLSELLGIALAPADSELD
ncbi:MAG: transposase [Myxococcota bacterium]|jgi:transposase